MIRKTSNHTLPAFIQPNVNFMPSRFSLQATSQSYALAFQHVDVYCIGMILCDLSFLFFNALKSFSKLTFNSSMAKSHRTHFALFDEAHKQSNGAFSYAYIAIRILFIFSHAHFQSAAISYATLN